MENNKNTRDYFNEITSQCLQVIEAKKKEYGSSVCRYRPNSITDRILTKILRIRSIQEKGKIRVNESIEETLKDAINYVLFRIWRLQEDKNVRAINVQKIKKITRETGDILAKKNHDYGEAWRKMRISSIIDECLVKIDRIVKMEMIIKKTLSKKKELNPKILDSLYDVINYIIFSLIHIAEGKDPMQ